MIPHLFHHGADGPCAQPLWVTTGQSALSVLWAVAGWWSYISVDPESSEAAWRLRGRAAMDYVKDVVGLGQCAALVAVFVSTAQYGGTPWQRYQHLIVVFRNSPLVTWLGHVVLYHSHEIASRAGHGRWERARVWAPAAVSAVLLVPCAVTHLLPAAVVFAPLSVGVAALLFGGYRGLSAVSRGGMLGSSDITFFNTMFAFVITVIAPVVFQLLAQYAVLFYDGTPWVDVWGDEYAMRGVACYYGHRDDSITGWLSAMMWI